jgi:hypothetical protein
MDTKDVAAVLLKTAGLIMIAYAVFELPRYFLPMADSSGQYSFVTALVQAAGTLALPVVLGALLWFFPATVTNKLVSGEKLSGTQCGVREFERTALTVVGAWLVAYGIADLIDHAVAIVVIQRQFPEQPTPLFTYMPGIIASVAKVVLGIGLAFGAKGIGRIINRVRGEG